MFAVYLMFAICLPCVCCALNVCNMFALCLLFAQRSFGRFFSIFILFGKHLRIKYFYGNNIIFVVKTLLRLLQSKFLGGYSNENSK